ncbi:4'-phosphopantetheinyl transferase family protein [Gilvibacter sp.]|uniref:4'-phosphopantetheinyl transferase family protein n=1 Tax=Gilvibacter sp. TaxID=2729997 RepID=UPI003F4A01F3
MPLYKTITAHNQTTVYLWKIEESFDDLQKGIDLQQAHAARVEGMKSDIHRRGFLSIRHLLALAGYNDHDLYYNDFGKPHLKDGTGISITHSFEFTGIIVGNQPVGIDIEKGRAKILKIAHKFTPLEEYRTLANEDALIRKLSLVWCAKETLYKMYGQPGLSFLKHIDVHDFDLGEAKETLATINYEGVKSLYRVFFLEFDGFSCAYGYPEEQ